MTMTAPRPSMENTDQNADNPEEKGSEEERLGTQSTIESVGPCKRRIKAEVPSDKVDEELNRNYKELISTVQIPGFRRGHVPRRLIEKRYGGEIEGDVKESLLNLSLAEVVKDKELKVLGKPKFDNVAFQKGEPLRYEVEVEVRPEFELGTYEGVEVEAEPVLAVKPEEVDLQIEGLRQKFAELVAVDPQEAGPEDIFVGHYLLRRDGLRVHSQEDVRIRPSTGFLDGFQVPELAEKIPSAKKAASSSPLVLTASVKVPDDYPAEVLRGAQVELEFTIEETKRVQLPPADDELAKRYDMPSIAEVRSRIEKQIEARNLRLANERTEEKVLQRIAENVQFELPEGLLEDQVKLQRLKLQIALIQEGRPPEEVEAELKKLAEGPATDALRREFKEFFILEKVAELQKIFATEDEVNMRVVMLAQAYGRPHQEVLEELEENDRLETLRAEIRHQKVRRFLREKARTGTSPAGAAAIPEAASPEKEEPPASGEAAGTTTTEPDRERPSSAAEAGT
jgi:trigger factor